MSDDRFYVRHIRAAQLCMKGAREYFDARSWDWNDFLDNGRPIFDLDVEGDTYAIKVAEAARRELANG